MTSPSTSRGYDVEAQQNVSQPHQLGEGEIQETTIHPSENARMSENLRAPGRADATLGTSISERLDTRQTSARGKARGEHDEVQSGPGTQAQHVVDHNSGPDDSSREPRMIGDFHGTLWNLYGKEAKSHDEARIQPLKEDMDGVLIFAGLFSAALTSFVVDSKGNLQANPADQTVYYLQQHSAILSQISQQIASIAPQVSIPSTPPPPFPSFKPSASDIRINAFWFMALTFSLSAALIAILVQQWVRDYMHVFQRYSDPQKSARMRQYLYEGSEGWYMPTAAEAVPGLLHVSLFLFFAGLADSAMNINTTIGLSTTVPIGICGLLYIFTTLAPVIYPQSPYQTSFSGLIWYAIQKFRGRSFTDLDGLRKSISTNMAQGQMQLSMEKTKERSGRDKRAFLWLLDNLTENAEIEAFVMSTPGSSEVWTDLSKADVIPVVVQPPLRLRMIRNVLGSGLIPRQFRTSTASRFSTIATALRRALHSAYSHRDRSITITPTDEKNPFRMSCWRIGHFFDTCKNRADFRDDGLWRMRARACVEVMASLVFNADAEVGWFGDTLQVLGDIGGFEEIHNLSLAKRDQVFVVQWTCFSIMAIRPTLGRFIPKRQTSNGFRISDYTDQVKKAREIDETLEQRWDKTQRRNKTEWRVTPEGPLSSEWLLSSEISFLAKEFEKRRAVINFDDVNLRLNEVEQRITRQLPSVHFDFPDSNPSLRQTLQLFCDPPKLRFISCRWSLEKLLDYLRRIEGYRDSSEYERVTKEVFWPKHLLQRMLWSREDLGEGRGLGFAVELFLLSLRQLLSTYLSHKSFAAPYIITFKAITADRRHKYPPGTQQILLDVVASDQGFLRTFDYPDYITDEVWELLGDILEGQRGSHIDGAEDRLTNIHHEVGGRYGDKALAVISRLRASH